MGLSKARKLLVMGVIGGAQAPVATFTCTTTGAETLTLAVLGVATGKSVTVTWGDGGSDTYAAGTAERTHNYAGAGTYTVTMTPPTAITYLDIRDAKVTLNSADIKSCTAIATLNLTGLKGGRFDSADVAAWRPTSFNLYQMSVLTGRFDSADVAAWRPTSFTLYGLPAGYTGTFNSSDLTAWTPTAFQFYAMPAGYTGTFNTSHLATWNPGTFVVLLMPAGYTFVVPSGGFAGWTGTSTCLFYSNGLTQAQVDQVLADFWAAFATRTATGGTLNVGGTNAAPSGVLQAANPPTTGKEYAYELVNDSQNINPTKKWATVTTA